MKNWKTTIAGVISGVLIILGMFLPEKFDIETQTTLNTALKSILAQTYQDFDVYILVVECVCLD